MLKSVTASQFGTRVTGLMELSNIPSTTITGNVFGVVANGDGVYLAQGGLYSIVGNTFSDSTLANSDGVVISGSIAAGNVTGNTFYKLNLGVILTSSSSRVNLQSNSYLSVNGMVSNAGSNNIVGGGSP